MSIEEKKFEPAKAELAAFTKKPWKTPEVITTSASSARQGGHLSADFSIAS